MVRYPPVFDRQYSRLAGARLLLWALALSLANPALAADSPFDQYRKALINYFQPFYLVPVLLPRGQKVGDVYDTQDFRLLSSATDCFPGLKPNGPVPSDLPAISLDIATSVAVAVGAPSIASADADLGISRQIHITFDGVQVSTATITAISHAYSHAKCPFLAPLVGFDKPYVATAPGSPPLVLAEVYSARRTVTFVLERKAAANASFDLAKFLSKLKLSTSVTAKASADAGDRITVVSEEVLPIAVRPAFVARHFLSGYMGPDSKPARLPGVTWEPFNTTDPNHQQAFTDIMNNLCTSPACVAGMEPAK